MMNSDISYTNQNNGPRRPHLSSTAFSEASSGFPGKWLLVGPWTLEDRRITCQRDHSLFHHDFTGSTTPSTTPTPRQRPRLELRLNGTYSYNYVERRGNRNPILTHVKNSSPTPQTPLFGTTPRTPRRAARRRSSSTTPLVGCSPPSPRPTGCCSSRNSPSSPMSSTTTTPPSTPSSAPDTEHDYPTPRTHREGQLREEEEPQHGHLGQLQQASPVHEPHLPDVEQLGHPRCLPTSASGQPHGRRPRSTGHRRRAVPRRQHNRECPGPRLKGPH